MVFGKELDQSERKPEEMQLSPLKCREGLHQL
jgi:hypothetical protein